MSLAGSYPQSQKDGSRRRHNHWDKYLKTSKTIILPLVLYECVTCSLTLMEECRLWVLENRMPRIIGPKRDEVRRDEKNYMRRSLLICTPNQTLFGWLMSRRMRREYHVALIVHRRVWCGNLRVTAHLDDQGACGRTTLKWIFRKLDWRVLSGLIWLE